MSNEPRHHHHRIAGLIHMQRHCASTAASSYVHLSLHFSMTQNRTQKDQINEKIMYVIE